MSARSLGMGEDAHATGSASAIQDRRPKESPRNPVLS